GLSVNYQQDIGWSGFIQIVHFNFLGWGERFMPIFRFGETYQKFGLEIINDRFFATPLAFNNGLYYEQLRPYFYDADGKKRGQLDVERMVAQFSAGIQPIKRMMILSGVRAQRVWTSQSEKLLLTAETEDRWLIFGRAIFDKTDDPYFPRKGVMVLLEAESNLGDEQVADYTKMSALVKWVVPMPWQQSISAKLFAGTATDDLPIYEKFRLGGPSDLPGYHQEELWGNHAAAIRFQYQIKVFKRWYWQANLFFVNVNDDVLKFDTFTRGISAGLLADSPLGPIGISYGWSETDRKQFYFSMGYEF
ncbi:MAG: BamA/TamA family outer membrane protein, partial [bacterium]|nr:BamA/TamA family outer membrane protein [bacterium]